MVAGCLPPSGCQCRSTCTGRCHFHFPYLQEPSLTLQRSGQESRPHGWDSSIQRGCGTYLSPNATMPGNRKDRQENERGNYSWNVEECFVHAEHEIRLWGEWGWERWQESGLGGRFRTIRTGRQVARNEWAATGRSRRIYEYICSTEKLSVLPGSTELVLPVQQAAIRCHQATETGR